MPCYEVRTISIVFSLGNIDLLKKAVEKMGLRWEQDRQILKIGKKNIWDTPITINLDNSTISSKYLNQREISTLSNDIKRSYSEVVIDQVAQKQRWIAKKLSDRKFQLNKY